MPTVEIKFPERKWPSLNRMRRHVFPTPESPRSITYNHHIVTLVHMAHQQKQQHIFTSRNIFFYRTFATRYSESEDSKGFFNEGLSSMTLVMQAPFWWKLLLLHCSFVRLLLLGDCLLLNDIFFRDSFRFPLSRRGRQTRYARRHQVTFTTVQTRRKTTSGYG